MDINKLDESLSPNERKILPYLEESLTDICKKSNLDKVSVTRALEYLQNKGIVKLEYQKKKILDVGVNGALYRKKLLPERRLLHLLDEKRIIPLQDATKLANLSNDEFKASLGALKKKAMVEIKNGKIILSAKKQEISRKTPEESLLETLPLDYDSLSPEQLYALKALENRKEIIEIKEEKTLKIEVTQIGINLIKSDTRTQDLIEQITPTLLKKDSSWQRKKFRTFHILHQFNSCNFSIFN